MACDIPVSYGASIIVGIMLTCGQSHNYTFTWDPKPDWSHFFAYGPEIQRYFEDFAERHGSKRYMKLSTKVLEGRWDEEQGIWNL